MRNVKSLYKFYFYFEVNMRYIFLLIVILMSVNISNAGLFFDRNTPNYTRYDNHQPYRNDLNRLERKIFKQTFDYDNQNNRIERLERKIFGACQSGSLDERLMLLQNASQNYKVYNPSYRTQQYYPPLFTGSQGSNWRNLVRGNFMNQFAGTATGFTPTITPAMDPAFMDYFEAERAMSGDMYDYQDNHKSYHSRVNRSSGTKVQILD